ncbi:MAG TPA: extracellular solute-binding protein [Pirellulaceae bacterium]|nr:extracellular solute-binding protein [Pirellulaceae bacterium]
MNSRLRTTALACALSTVLLGGCPFSEQSNDPSPEPKDTQPLRLVVVDDPALGAAIASEWQAQTEQSLETEQMTAAELAQAKLLPGDIVLFPTGMLGHCIEGGLIVPLSDDLLAAPQFDRRDIFDQIRLREMTWGNRTVAVSLGSPQILLAYRADLFEKLGLQPPADWAAYQELALKLAERAALGEAAPPDDQPWHATLEPLADGWAGQVLLARAAAYAMHPDQLSPLFNSDDAQPLIDRAPYVRALKELTAAAKVGGFADTRLTPQEALAELRAGHAAMALGWPAPPAGKVADKETTTGTIRYALLPGAKQSYNFATKRWTTSESGEPTRVPVLACSGRLAAVTSNSAARQRAESFVLWLGGKDASRQVAPRSSATAPYRQSQLREVELWTEGLDPGEARQYGVTLAAALSIPRVFPGLRLPGRLDYVAALDKAVQQAAAEQAAPDEALQHAAARWAEITNAIGADKQQQAILRSLSQADLK